MGFGNQGGGEFGEILHFAQLTKLRVTLKANNAFLLKSYSYTQTERHGADNKGACSNQNNLREQMSTKVNQCNKQKVCIHADAS